MSKVEPQRLTVEEFPEQADWIGKLFQSLNDFTGAVVGALTNGLSVEDNLYQEIKEIKFVNTTALYPYKFKTKFNLAPRGLNYIYIYNNTLSTYSTTAPYIVWSYANNQVSISNISGLTLGSTYTIRVLVIYK